MLDPEQFYTGKTLALAVDGTPDFIIERADYHYAGVYVECGRCQYFPIESPGRIYDSARERFGLRAGSLMALATASNARIKVSVESLMERLEFWGTGVARRDGHSAVSAADELVSRAMRHVKRCISDDHGQSTLDERFTDEENFISMVMKILQEACLKVMERNVDRAIERFAIRPDKTCLALSGGFALNCPSNSYLVSKYGFEQFLAPPCVNDTGQSIGIALATFFNRCPDVKFQFQFPGAFAGPGIDERELEETLHANSSHLVDVTEWDADRFVEDVRSAPVIWFDGPSEMGPRALGHRSLLADPTKLKMKVALNRIKKREWWRPVAPLVLEHCLDDWFESANPSPYMLQTFNIRRERVDQVAAIAHLDTSARVQTLRAEHDVRLFAALSAFHRSTGVPMLCNTSLNDKGDPIVNTVPEAINFAIRKGVAVGYFMGRRVRFALDRAVDLREGPLTRTIEPFLKPTFCEFTDIYDAINPQGLDPVHLYMYLTHPELRDGNNLRDAGDASRLRQRIDAMFRDDPKERISVEKYLSKVWSIHRHPCQDFGRHPWASLMKFPVEEILNVRPF
jgi:predicted NodU family carbamoyl transferase